MTYNVLSGTLNPTMPYRTDTDADVFFTLSKTDVTCTYADIVIYSSVQYRCVQVLLTSQSHSLLK